MAKLNEEQLVHLRKMLEQRERDLREEVHRGMTEREEFIDVSPTLPDPADASFATLASDLGHAEVARDVAELRAIVVALQRVEAGTYGKCIECETEIPYQRLEVQPAAERCSPCQERYEKTHGDMGRGATM